MSNSLDPDQARRFVGPDLGPNCLPKLSADDTERQRVKHRTRRYTQKQIPRPKEDKVQWLSTHKLKLINTVQQLFTIQK